MDYPKESAPFREGGYEYFYRNSGLQNQSLIYRRDDQGVKSYFLIQINSPPTAQRQSLRSLSLIPDPWLLIKSVKEERIGGRLQ